MMLRTPKPNKTGEGEEMCPVVQGYPMVVEKSEEPGQRYGIPLDHPAFHWFNKRLKHKQTAEYIRTTFGIPLPLIHKAIREGEKAYDRFNAELLEAGEKALADLKKTDAFGIILAGRPYHSDELVNHNLSKHFTRLGIPVFTLQSLPGFHSVNLRNTRMETFNPFHAQILEAALYAAKNPNLELVQIVSFGCGHDAILSDEMTRILRETSGKELLILKLDEGENIGPINIRIKSFIETIKGKRELAKRKAGPKNDTGYSELTDGFKVKFLKKDKPHKVVLVPNLSPPFAHISCVILKKLGYKAVPMPVADARAIELGKRYVHNDICYPAQINVGEILAYIERGHYPPSAVVAGLAKNCIACRAGHYATLARKALDDAGYPEVSILTTGKDTRNMHPGFKLSLKFSLNMLWGLTLVDGLEFMRRAIRPYELAKGETERVFDHSLSLIGEGLSKGVFQAEKAFVQAVAAFNAIPFDRTKRKPRVGIMGEVLMNYHPGANGFIENYLEENGMETILPNMVDFFRKKNVVELEMGKRGLHPMPRLLSLITGAKDLAYTLVHNRVENMLKKFVLYEPQHTALDISKNVEGIIDKSYLIGEGWLMPAEIIELAKHGVNSFVILNPFGCMPNHITGRGMIKTLKNMFPHIQILSLDYDPDTSFANIENRLQMLIITARELEEDKSAGTDSGKALTLAETI